MQVIDMNQEHTYYTFAQPRQHKIYFSSKLDSGNMHKVVRNSYDHYSIWTASDAQGTQFQGYPKSWFYFRVGGFNNRRVTFSIHRVHFLWAMTKKQQLYRPVFRICKLKEGQQSQSISEWNRLPTPIISLAMNNEDQLVLKFDYLFQGEVRWVQFAFIYPYSYEECRKDVLEYKQKYQNDKELCFKQYNFTKSVQDRIIDLLIISSHQGKEGYENIKIDQYMNFGGEKIVKFRSNKPIIVLTARVHPIETPSSFCMKGIIQFLLNKQDLRAHLLRKYFVFVIVPMLNPDGVSNGHCRMDTLNQNLNRYYKNPDPLKQPSCYAVKKLAQHYNKQKRIFMYLDLHAHPASKGNFIFGNAIFDYIQQVQSHLFPKILAQNCINFEFEQCNFSRKHMKAKDRYQDMNKEGCGRVVFYREFGVGHAYTLQCGYHCNSYDNKIAEPNQKDHQYKVKYKINQKGEKIYDPFEKLYPSQHEGQNIKQSQKKTIEAQQQQLFDIFSYTEEDLDDINSNYYKRDIVFFTEKTFQNLGKNILVSILDIWNKNPFTRVSEINQQRKQIAEKQSKLDRFKKQQAGIKAKQKKIVELIQEQYYGIWHKRNVMAIQTQQGQLRKRNQFQMIKSSQKARRTQKVLTLQTNKIIGQTLLSQPPQMPLPPTLQSNPSETTTQIKIVHPISGYPSSLNHSQNSKPADSKNIFRPMMNMRIRNLMMSNNK